MLGFFGSAGGSVPLRALSVIGEWRDIFDDMFPSFFGISVDPDNEQQGRTFPDLTSGSIRLSSLRYLAVVRPALSQTRDNLGALGRQVRRPDGDASRTGHQAYSHED